MKNWMKKLSTHYEKARSLYPEDRLLILFDIDGTILDMRHMILHLLKTFDQSHGTRFFECLRLVNINIHENQVEHLLTEMEIPLKDQENILEWYHAYRWSRKAILRSHRPFAGVMEVIRWFQMQPNTFVGLNTGRPESLRADTLRSLNKLGEEYKVQFTSELLHMNPHGWEIDVSAGKAAAVNYFRKAGYRVFAMVDNEPENLMAISNVDPNQEILLLHANTIFESKRKKLPSRSLSGKSYDITELIQEKALPQHIQFVWHGANDEANLRQFLGSNIQWAECDVRIDSSGKNIVLRHDSFEETPLEEEEELVYLKDVLDVINSTGKSIKLDLKENGPLLDKVFEILKIHGFEDSRLWFNSNIEVLEEKGFRRLKEEYPGAIIQCPIDDHVTIILREPVKAKKLLSNYSIWGINRFSIKWSRSGLRKVFDRMDRLGFEVNIYQVPDLVTFLHTILLIPKSITSDFNFPKWHYFGRGSGERRRHYEYAIAKVMFGRKGVMMKGC